ncbi:MAG: hypothetical protein R3B09_08990 [Nannocystaceae bacterium]
MTRSLPLLALPLLALPLLFGCDAAALDPGPAPDPREAATEVAPADPPAELSLAELSRVDARGTHAAISVIAAKIAALDDDARAEAAASLRALSVRCPYTRAAMQLPFALQAAVAAIDAEQLDPLVRGDWDHLQRGLAAHVELLRGLGVDLPAPAPGDPLHDAAPGLMLDRDALLASDDPLAATARLVGAITTIAQGLDPSLAAELDRHSDRLEAITGVERPCPRGPWAVLPGHPWTLGMQLGGWHDALRRVAPFVEDPAARADVEAMIDALDRYAEAGLESRT